MNYAVLYHVSYWLCDHLFCFALFIWSLACRMGMDGPLDPLCLWAGRHPHGGLDRGGVGGVGQEDCHIQMLQICSLPHMWIGMPLSGALLVLHEHSQEDKPAETEVRPSVNLLWCWITRFTWLYPLIFSVVNSWRLSRLRLNWQFKQGTWELQKHMWHNVTEYWILVFDSLFLLCTLNCAVLCSPGEHMQLVLLHWKHIFMLFGDTGTEGQSSAKNCTWTCKDCFQTGT